MRTLRNFGIRLVLLGGIILLTVYLIYRVTFINFSPAIALFSVVLFLAELHTIFHFYGMFYSLWPRNYTQYNELNPDRDLRVNMLICVCGEPEEIVKNTIEGAKKAAAKYETIIKPKYKPKIVVLNDGMAAKKDNWRQIKSLAEGLKVGYLARETTKGFKAGNINNGIDNLPTTNPDKTIDIIFDADFMALDNFLLEILKPFKNKKVDFVQSPQRYQNEVTWVAKAAAAHQIFFFDHICPAKGYDNSLFLCGTNFAIKRSALLEVGKMDDRFITEDYATSLNLHLKGKVGVFMEKVLALGIAPSSMKAYSSQQQRWSKGNFDVTSAYLWQLLFGSLSLRQKFHYLLSATYYLIGLRDMILILAPIPYLFFGIPLIRGNTLHFLLFIYGPLLIYNFILYVILFRHPIKSLILDIVSFPVFVASLISAVFKKKLGFVITIKGYQKENPLKVYRLQLGIAVLLIAGLVYSISQRIIHGFGIFINYFWATYDAIFLMLGFFLIIRENYRLGFLERVVDSAANHVPFKQIAFRPVSILSCFLIISMLGANPTIYPAEIYLSVKSMMVDKNTSGELLVPNTGVYYGYYMPDLNKHPKDPKVGLFDGEKPSLTMFYSDWGSGEGLDTSFLKSLTAQNIIPVITWEPWDSKVAATSLQQPKYSLKSINRGDHDEYIRRWAKEAADYKKPIFLRFAHEMNGNWYGWGNMGGNTPDDYKKAWIHVHNIFKEEHADNVLWVWSPNNTDEQGNIDSMLNYYPGAKYVDWVGFSGFNWGTTNPQNNWQTFFDITDSAYKVLSTLNKPIMVAETSSAGFGGSKSLWFEDTLLSAIPSYPNIKAVIFFNEDFKNADFELSNDELVREVLTTDLVDNGYYIKQPYLTT